MSILADVLGRRTRDASGLTLSEGEVAAALAGLRGGPTSHAAVNIAGRAALKNNTVWAAVRLIADALASMPAHLYERDADGNPHQVDEQPGLVAEPSWDIEWGEWIYGHVAAAASLGNTFGEVVNRDADGRVSQIEDLDPATVRVRERYTDASGRHAIGYWVGAGQIPTGDVWHLAAYRWPGSRLGLSPVAHTRQQILIGILAERFGLEVYRNDGRVTGVLTSDQELDDGDVQTISANWRKALARGTVPVLGKGSKFERVTLTLEEAQALDVQQWSAEQVSRALGVPPEMLSLAASGQSITYANRSQAVTHWHQMSLAGWQRRIESRATRLWDPARETGQYIKLSAAGLLRADTKERYETYAIGLRERFLETGEVRAWEELPPLETDPEPAPDPGALDVVYDEDGNVIQLTPARHAP